jgi:hypothetical protein
MGLLLILEMQSLNIIGFDFISPIYLITIRGARFIFVIVDYFNRYP